MAKVGSFVRDRLTGLKGVVMVRAEYLTGCIHVGICKQTLTKDGKEPDWVWIDERRCEVMKEDAGVMERPARPDVPVYIGRRIGGPSPCGPKS